MSVFTPLNLKNLPLKKIIIIAININFVKSAMMNYVLFVAILPANIVVLMANVLLNKQ